MTACDRGGIAQPGKQLVPRQAPVPLLKECDVCGSNDLAELKCKVICANCRTILQSCADL